MINPIDFKDIMKPLEKLYGSIDQDVAQLYYQHLKYSDEVMFKQGLDNLIETMTRFPKIPEMKRAYNEVKNKANVSLGPGQLAKGCGSCEFGWVYFTYPVYNLEHVVKGKISQAAAPCGYCVPGDTYPQVILNDGKIFVVGVDKGKDGRKWYVPDLDHPREIPSSLPGNRIDRMIAEGEEPF